MSRGGATKTRMRGGVGWLLSLRAEVEDGGERELGNGERCHDIGVEDGRDLDPSASCAIGTDLNLETDAGVRGGGGVTSFSRKWS